MNTTKSEQIKAGLRKSFQTGESAKASTVCYGYKVTSEGKLVAYPTDCLHAADADCLQSGCICVFQIQLQREKCDIHISAGDDDDSGGNHDSGDLSDVQQGTHA